MKQETTRRDFAKLSLFGLAAGVQACATTEPQRQSSGSFVETVGGVDAEGPSLAAGITTDTIAEAEKLFLLDYTEAEREQILAAGFENLLDALRTMRNVGIPNTLQPAMTFDPRLAGFETPAPGDGAVRVGAGSGRAPGSEEDIAFASIVDQGRWLRSGAISSRELTEIYLRRIDRYGPVLECFVTVTAELARQQAEIADREMRAGRDRGPLHGLPYALKDIIDVAGYRGTWGAVPYQDRMAGPDATIVNQLREAGAVLLGKSTVGAIAYGDVWFGGVTRNPWNRQEGSSGSSAGSASSTAAGLCAFSIGTETLGSIVSPATRCGATGLRPTFGRVSRAGAMALCWSLDKIGPICRYTDDTALVLDAINGYDPADASSIGAGLAYDANASLSGMRVGYAPEWFEDASPVDQAALQALRGTGVQLVEVAAPTTPADALISIVLVESAAAFEELTLSNRDDLMVRQDDSAWPNSWRQARLYSAADYVQVDRVRRLHMEEFDRLFSGVDAVFGPSFAGGMLARTNYTGHPCVAIRAGFEQRASSPAPGSPPPGDDAPTFRVPRSVTVWGPLFKEHNALIVAKALEDALGVADERPPMDQAV